MPIFIEKTNSGSAGTFNGEPMPDDLNEKLSRVKDEHAAVAIEQQGAEFAKQALTDAVFMLGRIKQNEHVAEAIFTGLSAQSIRAVEAFGKAKQFLPLGFDRLDTFLDKSPLSPMTKHQYYERLNLIKTLGDPEYDLLTSAGISVRSAKLLGTGDLSIKGDRLMIGEAEVEIGDSGVIKQAIQELCDDRRKLQDEAKAAAKKADDLRDQVERGVAENEQLQRNIDAMRSRNPHDTAVMLSVNQLLELAEAIGSLPDELKAKHAANILPVLNTALQRVRAAYGTNFSFTVETQAPDNVLDEIAAQVNAIDDDEDGLD